LRTGLRSPSTIHDSKPSLREARAEIELLEHRRALDKIRQQRARKKRRANPQANEAYKKGQRQRAAAATALAAKRDRNARKAAIERRLTRTQDEQLTRTISAATLRRPKFVIIAPNGKRQREILETEGPCDPIAAQMPPLTKRRSPRETAMLEAIAKMYGQSATYEQIADGILHDFDISEGAPE
jgi:hypothetical protein